jgi:hypothetical protein
MTVEASPAGANDEPVFSVRAFNGNVTMTVPASGAVEKLKAYGLPLLLLYAVFLAALFEVLRRLFRNVGRGESFTPQSVRLVQIVGGALIVFSILCAIGENWFAHGMYAYLANQTHFAISGTPARLPPPGPGAHWRLFDRSTLFYGLLILALAEVFRQGLVLRRENELTV